MEITTTERKVLQGIKDSDYVNCDVNSEDIIDYPVWMFSVADASGVTGKTFSGVCSSLHKKGLIETETTGDRSMIGVAIQDTYTMSLTKKGFETLK